MKKSRTLFLTAVALSMAALPMTALAEDQGDGAAVSGLGGVTEVADSYVPGSDDCDHVFERQEDSHEATDTEGGLRHFACSQCGLEYAYTTDPLVYEDGDVTGAGTEVEVNEGSIGAVNPYLPLYVHTADGEPRVYWSKEDGEWRVYVYCSLDTQETGYCSENYVIYSAPVYDLTQWRFEDTVMCPNGIAGDCAYNPYNDMYYFVNMGQIWRSDRPDGGFDGEDGGVKVFQTSASGFGPGEDSTEAETETEADPETLSNPDSLMLFDPALYIDEEGKMTMISSSWGDPNVYHVSTMSEDYSRIDSYYTIQVEEGTGVGEDENMLPYPYEGPSIRCLEFDGQKVYVLIYASDYKELVNGDHYESVLSYAWTTDLSNPVWNYGGIVYDTAGYYTLNQDGEIERGDEATFNYDNNHGGIECINGQWYIFGHRNTYLGHGSRQGMAEQLNISWDGETLTIETAEMTSSGLADYLDAYQTYDAAIACYMTPSIYNGSSHESEPSLYVGKSPVDSPEIIEPWNATEDSVATHAYPIMGIADSVEIGYKYLNFGEEETTATLSLLVSQAEGYTDGTVDVYLDAPTEEEGGTLIGSLSISADEIAAGSEKETGTDGTEWTWISGQMDQPVSGTHGVYLVFSSQDEGTICMMDQIAFAKSE